MTDTATVAIRIQNADGANEKMLTVNTKDTGVYSTDLVPAYNTPIASVSGLNYGEHIVTIYVSTPGNDGFIFDGFRVYNTCNSSNTTAQAAYTADLEENPAYYELRNAVLKGLNINPEDSQYAADIAKKLAQVYTTGEENGAILLDSTTTSDQIVAEKSTAQELLDKGPKNELYLKAGQTVVFKLNTNRQVQIGMRSVTGGNVSYTINGIENTMKSSVDMFYDLQVKGTSDEKVYSISVPKEQTGVLSITDIKVSDCADENIFAELTEADFENVLLDMGYAAEPTEPEVTYADATLNIALTDGDVVLASSALTANGVTGEVHTFTAETIAAEVNGMLPEGYELTDSAFADAEVIYGEAGEVSFKASVKETEIETETETETETDTEAGPDQNPKPSTDIVNKIIDFFKGLFGRR